MKKILILMFFIQCTYAAPIKKILVFGGMNGWIGKKIVKLLQDMGQNPICAQSRLENRQDIINEIEHYKPDFIINAAGIIGNPNVDWCENHKQQTIRTNVLGTLNLIDVFINVPNSLCVLDDLLPIAVDMALRELKGNYNFVNPGAISHNEVLDLYKQYIDSTHTYENFSLEEQNAILKARRANAELSAEKLLTLYPGIPHIKNSLARLLITIKKLQK